jgi:phage terminase Nu1 subunit (DNA packaging protein)
MRQLISWSRRRFAQVRSQRAEKERPETRFACDRDRFADTQVVQERRAGQGARKASEIVMLTCRTLHLSRVAICSKLVTLPVTISLGQRRPREGRSWVVTK